MISECQGINPMILVDAKEKQKEENQEKENQEEEKQEEEKQEEEDITKCIKPNCLILNYIVWVHLDPVQLISHTNE